MTVELEPFVDGHAVAEFLSVDHKWIERMGHTLPRHRVGGRWRYRLSEVAEAVKEGALAAGVRSGTGRTIRYYDGSVDDRP